MMSQLLKRVLPFSLTLILGTGMWNVFGIKRTSNNARRGHRCTKERIIANEPTPVRILSPTETRYGPDEQANDETGVVRLRVSFNPDGTSRVVNVLTSTRPLRLTDDAIRVVSQIRFVPAMLNGQPVAETRVVRFAFDLNDDRNYVISLSDYKSTTKGP